jgi:hypothetical protein
MSMPLLAAKRTLDDWLSCASLSSLDPFVKLARTIRLYRDSIEATIEWKLTNGISKSNNTAIGRIRSAAWGFHDPESFITMIMLDRTGIATQLPWAVLSHDLRHRQKTRCSHLFGQFHLRPRSHGSQAPAHHRTTGGPQPRCEPSGARSDGHGGACSGDHTQISAGAGVAAAVGVDS